MAVRGSLMRDYRNIPVDVLRDFALTQTHITSIRAVADQIGLGRSTLHKFVLGRTMPQPRVRRLLGLWYLECQTRAADIDIARPYLAALATLLADILSPERDAARQEVLAALQEIYGKRGERPRWLEIVSPHRRNESL